MHQIKVTGIQIIPECRKVKNLAGNTILAWFSTEVNGLFLVDCALVRTPQGDLTVWPPKRRSDIEGQQPVKFIDRGLRKELTAHARTAFKAMGGSEDEANPADIRQPNSITGGHHAHA